MLVFDAKKKRAVVLLKQREEKKKSKKKKNSGFSFKLRPYKAFKMRKTGRFFFLNIALKKKMKRR